MLGKRKRASSPIRRQLFAIGDIHGDFAALLRQLYVAKVIDENGAWRRKQRHVLVVLLGDVVLVPVG